MNRKFVKEGKKLKFERRKERKRETKKERLNDRQTDSYKNN